MKPILTLLFSCFFSPALFAQSLVYKPRNPAFGGDTFNYQWLMSSAENQNKFKDKSLEKVEKTELERFTESLNSQLLNQITRSLFTQQFGTSGVTEGSYTFGSLSVDIYPSEGGLSVTILDTNTGEQTTVIIPKK